MHVARSFSHIFKTYAVRWERGIHPYRAEAEKEVGTQAAASQAGKRNLPTWAGLSGGSHGRAVTNRRARHLNRSMR